MNGRAHRVIVSGACAPDSISEEAVLTVIDNNQIANQPVGDDICEGTNTSFIVDAGITTNASYQWYMDTGSGMAALGVDGQHSDVTEATLNITGALFAMDENKYQVEVMGDCGPSVFSDIIELIVYKSPEIIDQPLNDTTCEFAGASFSITTGDTDAPDIQWFENDGVNDWQPLSNSGTVSGALSATLQLFAVDSAMNGYEYRAEVSNLCGGPAISDAATLTVQNPAAIWQQPADITVCEGTQADFEVEATGTDLSYQWQVDMRDTNGFQNLLDTGVYAGSDAALLEVNAPSSRFNGYRYRVVVESADCAPPRTSTYAQLRVDEVAEIVTPPTAKEICEGASTAFSVDAGVTTDPTYTWAVDDGSGGGYEVIDAATDPAVYSGQGSPTLILGGVPADYNGNLYRVTVGGVCPDIATVSDVLLTVNEQPEILADPVNDTVCENSA
ncbi:MAG: hypothetical protein LC650_03010, partial [Actinobacteria bacterium]|nr:hypothetical protein [Actinomycetota bacterium]